MRHIFNNLEIYLTFAGLGVIFLTGALLRQYGYWYVLSITAIAVGVVHGILFWTVRRQQRRVRQALIADIRPMLADRINSRLTVLLAAADDMRLEGNSPSLVISADDREAIAAAVRAAQEIRMTIDRLSLDAIRHWQHHYDMSESGVGSGAGRERSIRG